jgi:hypothetical protein
MSIKKLSFMLLSALSLAALLNGCGSSNKEGNSPGGVAKVDEATCRVCHATSIDPISKTNIVQDFLGSPATSTSPATPPSVHYQLPDGTLNTEAGCQGCHGGGAQHNGVGPIPFPDPLASNRCVECHTNVPVTAVSGLDFVGNCAPCHTSNGIGGLHAAQLISATTLRKPDNCIGCHDIAAPQHGSLVGDNNGVRNIVQEFSKWSHHVTGVNLQNAHCAACHLEGQVSADGKTIQVNSTYHMADNKTHLRNADTDADMQWDPATPNFSTMDNFCMSCHDANGATSPQSAAIRALMVPAAGKTASASNPFGDTISNRYDKMQRPAVVDASSQFNTSNNSHHAVKGKRYSGRTRKAGDPRTIASAATFAANSSATLQGARSTIFDAGNFNALYSPLGTDGTAATGLGDDSTLHCGDCHTVGQWKVGSSDTANGSPTPAAIGAHGSNNEYLLRNTLGTDQRHTQNAFILSATNVVTYTNPNGAFLVCYNCHSYTRYGSIYVGTGLNIGAGQQPHAGEYDQAGRCNGVGNTLPFNGYTTGTATDGTQFASRFIGPISKFSSIAPYAGEQDPDFGDIFGIQCANCHNSGAGNAYGGIHGSAKNQQTLPATVITGATVPAGGYYIDGMGNATKIERFLPGLGNAMHVPGTQGGFTGGSLATFLRYSANAAGTSSTVLPVRDNTLVNTTTNKKVGSYTYTTGGVSNDTNWEQKHWQQVPGMVINQTTGAISGATLTSQGAGCYTLGTTVTALNNPSRPAATNAITAPPVTGQGGAATTLLDTWGGCEDHGAPQGGGDHGFVKRIVRPVTY